MHLPGAEGASVAICTYRMGQDIFLYKTEQCGWHCTYPIPMCSALDTSLLKHSPVSLNSLSLTGLWTPTWKRPTISHGDQWVGRKNECINQAPIDSSFLRDTLHASIVVFGSLLFNGTINSNAQIRKGRWKWANGMEVNIGSWAHGSGPKPACSPLAACQFRWWSCPANDESWR